jgi:hypothetical protein
VAEAASASEQVSLVSEVTMHTWLFLLILILSFIVALVVCRLIFRKESGSKFSIFLSVFALCVSFWSSFSPSSVEVVVNSPVWIGRNNGLGLKLTCVFANSGAQTGIVTDILLKMEGKDKTSAFLFFPTMVIDETEFTMEAKPDIKFLKGPFYPVAVQGRQSSVLSFVFAKYSGNPNFQSVNITPQEYKFTVLTKMGTSTKYETQQSFTVNLNQDSIRTLMQGTMVQEDFDLNSSRKLVR